MSMAMKFALACMAYATVVMLVAKQAPEQAPYIAGLAGPVLLVIVGEIMKRGWFGLGKLTAVRIAFGRDDNDEVETLEGRAAIDRLMSWAKQQQDRRLHAEVGVLRAFSQGYDAGLAAQDDEEKTKLKAIEEFDLPERS